MPRASRFLKPKFLTATDVREFGSDGRETTITTTKVVRVAGEEKLVVFFADIERGYVCNQNNLEALLEMHGGDDDTAHWTGTSVHVYVDESILFSDQQVGGIVIEQSSKEVKRTLFGSKK